MRKRLPRADKKLIIPGGDKSPGKQPKEETIVLHGKDEKKGGYDPTVVLQESIPVINATTLAEEHQGVKQVHRDLENHPDSEDWGGGFMAFPEPAHVLRGPDGNIANVTPLSEIPGVELTREQEEVAAVVADAKPTPVPLNREDRHKLISILATRMFKYYRQLPKDYPGYHPFRDGIPDVPDGSPKNLNPTGQDLHPATDAQIFQWLYKFCGARATVINKNKHGGGIQDLALRIE